MPPEKKLLVLHPALFAVSPILFLFGHNRSEALVLPQILPSLLVSLLAALLLWGALNLIFRNRRKSAVIVSLFLLLFYSYGHLHTALAGVNVVGVKLWQHRYLFGLYGLIFLVALWRTIATPRKLEGLTAILNVAAFSLVAISLFNAVFPGGGRTAGRQLAAERSAAPPSPAPPPADSPDIYYILLDGYGRADTLSEIYGYDNTEFIKFLEARGFYLATQSRANYAFTAPSLASALNLEYLDYLRGSDGDNPGSSVALYYLIENNRAVRFLKSRGYTFVHFDSGWSGNERNRHADIMVRSGYGNEFTMILAQTTLLFPFRKSMNFLAGDARERILGAFSGLAEVHRTVPGPKFVFAHIVSPHPPFLFGPQGEERELDLLSLTRWEKRSAYVDQVKFVNFKVKELLPVLLDPDHPPPIIILQADHGPISVGGFADPSDRFLQERMRIFNAYYLPGGGNELLYPAISAVNNFRLIFSYYFDEDYPLLPDRSFYAGKTTSYDFYEVTDRVLSPVESAPEAE